MKTFIPNLNPDGEIFQNASGPGQIKIDYAKNQFTITEKPGETPSTVVNLDKSYLQRGEFFYLTREHALWMLRPSVAVPAEWNKNKKEGIQADTPLVILFHKDKQVYRLVQKDLGFTHVVKNPKITLMGYTGPIEKEAYETWLSNYKIFVPQSTGRSSSAFIPRLTLQEVTTVENKNFKINKVIEIQALTGSVKEIPSFEPEPATPASTSGAGSQQWQEYNKALEELMTWYREENSKLAPLVDKMSDKEVLAATEKLTAEYNRRLIKLQAKLAK